VRSFAISPLKPGNLLQLVDFRVHGAGRRQTLQNFADAEKIVDHRRGKVDHEDAPAGSPLDETLSF